VSLCILSQSRKTENQVAKRPCTISLLQEGKLQLGELQKGELLAVHPLSHLREKLWGCKDGHWAETQVQMA
jgi:hypothetical protein